MMRAETPLPELNRFLYAAVGRPWLWTDRLNRTREQWVEYLSRPGFETWVAYEAGTPCGFFELDRQPGGNCEVRIFGLLPHGVGHGVGGGMLTFAVRRGFEVGSLRVWLHTCTRDHPVALQNYLARGFLMYGFTREKEPERETPPWPG